MPGNRPAPRGRGRVGLATGRPALLCAIRAADYQAGTEAAEAECAVSASDRSLQPADRTSRYSVLSTLRMANATNEVRADGGEGGVAGVRHGNAELQPE